MKIMLYLPGVTPADSPFRCCSIKRAALASRPSSLTQPFYCAAGRDFGMLFGSSAGTGFSGC